MGTIKVEISLVRKKWQTVEFNDCVVHVCGRAHNKDNGNLYSSSDLARQFVLVPELMALVKSLNGNWAVVMEKKDGVFFSVDHIRSTQLLYAIESDDRICIFDDLEHYRKTHSLEFDPDAVQEYLSSGFVYGNRTLFKNIYSLQSGECAVVNQSNEQSIERHRYYRFHAIPGRPFDPVSFVKQADEMFLSAFRRMLETIGDRRIAVPLSGGCDSRLIVNYLHRLGARNVVTFSYGFPNNREAVIAKQIAAGLGYPWHFIEYDAGLREREVYDFNDAEHNRYMCNGVNRPCKQDFHAIKELLSRGVIAPGDVMMPGYTFDVSAGSFLQENVYPWSVVAECQGHDADFFEYGMWRFLNRRIGLLRKENRDLNAEQFWETFLCQERLVKFAINNVHTYDLFGFDWRLPLWDTDLTDFWMSIPHKERLGRKWFYEHLTEWLEPEIRDIPYYNIHSVSSLKNPVRKFGAYLQSRTPNMIKHYGRSLRDAMRLHPQVVSDDNPQSGAVAMRGEMRERVIAAFPECGLRTRLTKSHNMSRGAIEAMVSLLQMVEG